MDLGEGYLRELKKRKKETRAYTKHQVLGLEISRILGDEKHKSLFIKLAKEGDANELLETAKKIAEKSSISNKGAYFMKVIQSSRKNRELKK